MHQAGQYCSVENALGLMMIYTLLAIPRSLRVDGECAMPTIITVQRIAQSEAPQMEILLVHPSARLIRQPCGALNDGA